jgi:hypothetical protein
MVIKKIMDTYNKFKKGEINNLKTVIEFYKKVFTFRDRNQKIGTILGSFCFLPAFLMILISGIINPKIFTFCLVTLVFCQWLWLTSITLCTWSLENENRHLKEKLKKKEGNDVVK